MNSTVPRAKRVRAKRTLAKPSSNTKTLAARFAEVGTDGDAAYLEELKTVERVARDRESERLHRYRNMPAWEAMRELMTGAHAEGQAWLVKSFDGYLQVFVDELARMIESAERRHKEGIESRSR